MFDFDLLGLVAGIPGLIIALAIHEYSHARMAVAMGDETPKYTGRLTLNPIAHIDPIGLIMLFVARFGWAKPVMINSDNFRNRRQGEVLTALAGPAANFVTAFVFLFLTALVLRLGLPVSQGLIIVFQLIVIYNVNFGIFNLIPIPPLDGSRVITAFLPTEWEYKLAGYERYSFLIFVFLQNFQVRENHTFVLLFMSGAFGYILLPVQRLIMHGYGVILSALGLM